MTTYRSFRPCGADLARVADALALVGLRLAQLADVRSDLAHGLLGDAADGQLVVALDLERDAGGRLHGDRVRVAQGEGHARPGGLHAVAGADHLEALRVALGHADDVVRDQGAGEAVERARLALVVGTAHENLPLLQLDLDGLRHGERELALGALDRDVAAVDRDGHAARDVDGKSSDS